MRTPALASFALLLLAPARQARAEETPRPRPCLVTVIQASTSAGPEVPALRPYQALLSAKPYKKWKSFSLVSQARYWLPEGGKAVLATQKAPLELALVSREKGVTQATFKVGKRKAVQLALTEAAPAELVEGEKVKGGLLLYGVHCAPAAP